jgi:hypothetical protein
MPAGFAHITLVNILSRKLEQIAGFPEKAITAVLDYLKFVELGAVSPDYPYLAVGDSDAAKWADSMHYDHTVEMIRSGVHQLRDLEGEAQRKGLAWLLGYSAHVATDVTIHPVVQLKVGPYQGNEKAHRHCEMHQDAFIFQRLNLGEIGLSDYLNSGIRACGDPSDSHCLDQDIRELWSAMLTEVYPKEFENNPPDIDKWHHRFGMVIDDIAEEGNRLLPCARHVAQGLDLVYPDESEIDSQYLDDLDTPNGKKQYDVVFDRAVEKVGGVWREIADGVLKDRIVLAQWVNWNLDTGRDENDQLVFWG